ncbi:hypothetical protein L7F22_035733 [Adiantum nelumboides]|nr:hypothetical protein [Adiantum nelumboides]
MLTQLGMRETHKLADVGCGSLRGGRLSIMYLRPGNYYGIEPTAWALHDGIAAHLGEEFVGLKQPTFLEDAEYSLEKFERVRPGTDPARAGGTRRARRTRRGSGRRRRAVRRRRLRTRGRRRAARHPAYAGATRLAAAGDRRRWLHRGADRRRSRRRARVAGRRGRGDAGTGTARDGGAGARRSGRTDRSRARQLVRPDRHGGRPPLGGRSGHGTDGLGRSPRWRRRVPAAGAGRAPRHRGPATRSRTPSGAAGAGPRRRGRDPDRRRGRAASARRQPRGRRLLRGDARRPRPGRVRYRRTQQPPRRQRPARGQHLGQFAEHGADGDAHRPAGPGPASGVRRSRSRRAAARHRRHRLRVRRAPRGGDRARRARHPARPPSRHLPAARRRRRHLPDGVRAGRGHPRRPVAVPGVVATVLVADVGDPDRFAADLWADAGVDLADLIHTQMFLLHDRELADLDPDAAAARLDRAAEACRSDLLHDMLLRFGNCGPATAADRFTTPHTVAGTVVAPVVGAADLVELVQRWTPYLRHGLLLVEAHVPVPDGGAVRGDVDPAPAVWGVHVASEQFPDALPGARAGHGTRRPGPHLQRQHRHAGCPRDGRHRDAHAAGPLRGGRRHDHHGRARHADTASRPRRAGAGTPGGRRARRCRTGGLDRRSSRPGHGARARLRGGLHRTGARRHRARRCDDSARGPSHGPPHARRAGRTHAGLPEAVRRPVVLVSCAQCPSTQVPSEQGPPAGDDTVVALRVGPSGRLDGRVRGGPAVAGADPAIASGFADVVAAAVAAALADPDATVAVVGTEAARTAGLRPAILYGDRTTCEVDLLGSWDHQVNQRPDAVAIVDGEQHHTYAQLESRAAGLAAALDGLDLPAGAPVAIAWDRCLDAVAAVLAAMRTGRAWVPVPPDLPRARRAEMVRATGAVAVLGPDASPDADLGLPRVSAGAEVSRRPRPTPTPDPDADLCVLFTSGSTGRPAGVRISHAAAANRLQWMWARHPWEDHGCGVWLKSLGLVGSLWEVFGGLLAGRPTVIAAMADLVDPARLWDLLDRHRVTRLLTAPPILHLLLTRARRPGVHVGQALSLVTSSAEPLSAELAGAWRYRFPRASPAQPVRAHRVRVQRRRRRDRRYGRHGRRRWLGPCVARCPDRQLPARRRRRGRCTDAAGVAGELVVGGVCVGKPLDGADTARFGHDGDGSGAPHVRTGDLARLGADGRIVLVGRRDNQVKLRGHRIALEEVESRSAGGRRPLRGRVRAGRGGQRRRAGLLVRRPPGRRAGHRRGRGGGPGRALPRDPARAARAGPVPAGRGDPSLPSGKIDRPRCATATATGSATARSPTRRPGRWPGPSSRSRSWSGTRSRRGTGSPAWTCTRCGWSNYTNDCVPGHPSSLTWWTFFGARPSRTSGG